MNLAIDLLRQIDSPALSHDERVRLRCRLAKEMEEAGNYEAARHALGELWQRVGERPVLDGLERRTAAELLLRAGSLSGWIGSAGQIEGAQEAAKDLITAGIRLFEALREMEKVCEAQIDLAICYWREGSFDEARVILREVLDRLDGRESEHKALALLRSALIERSATRFNDALRILNESAPLFEASDNHALKGRFHGELATVLKALATSEGREDYLDRALVEYAAASFHFEQAGHTRYCARVENNLGFLFLTVSKFAEAHEHLDRARQLFAGLRDRGSVAQVDETRARAFLAQGRNSDAERTVRAAVRALEKGGEQSLLAEALATHGKALARLGRHEQAQTTFERAIEVAHQAGDFEGAGQAALNIIEELSERHTPAEMSATYERADQLLSRSQHPEILARLRSCARRVLAAYRRPVEKSHVPGFVYASQQAGALLDEARSVAGADGPVLITGETGAGKEVLARMIHEWSGRAGRFVTINCAALTEALFESQLFGHKKGSFTDAIEDYPGAARVAAGGTLFLDEVAELSASNQGKLLRLIELGEIRAIGAPVPECIDVRIIAATNSDIKGLVAGGQFRKDLFYRLQNFHLEVPPLRERPEDIPAIAEHFIGEARARHRKQVTFTPEAVRAMSQLPLKGNARELHSLIERTMITAAEGSTITAEMVETVALRQTHRAGLASPWADFSLKSEVRSLEQRFIELALRDANGMVSRAARLLGFKHHESLNSLLRTKYKDLFHARTPVTPRKRSIIRVARHQ